MVCAQIKRAAFAGKQQVEVADLHKHGRFFVVCDKMWYSVVVCDSVWFVVGGCVWLRMVVCGKQQVGVADLCMHGYTVPP